MIILPVSARCPSNFSSIATLAIELLFHSPCSAHGLLGIFHQEIVVVNEIVLQYTKNLFS